MACILLEKKPPAHQKRTRANRFASRCLRLHPLLPGVQYSRVPDRLVVVIVVVHLRQNDKKQARKDNTQSNEIQYAGRKKRRKVRNYKSVFMSGKCFDTAIAKFDAAFSLRVETLPIPVFGDLKPIWLFTVQKWDYRTLYWHPGVRNLDQFTASYLPDWLSFPGITDRPTCRLPLPRQTASLQVQAGPAIE